MSFKEKEQDYSIVKLEGSSGNYPLWKANVLKVINSKKAGLVMSMDIPHDAITRYNSISSANHLKISHFLKKDENAKIDLHDFKT